MTLIALNKPSMGPSPVSPHRTNPPLPRFNLKKRAVSDDRESISLSVVNSAFLSGLFADVAKVQVASPPPSSQDSDPRLDSSKSFKKIRLSKSKSMTRCGKSFKTLSDAVEDSVPKSPAAAADFFGIFPTPTACPDSAADLERHDSLHYQLSCVSRSSSSEDESGLHPTTVIDAGKLAFPRLPSVVGASSSKLTRKISDLQMSVLSESTPPKDSYGWFVEMDDHEPSPQLMPNPYGAATTSKDLAFMAPTAPKAHNYDAEVEWAKAADTVDDVLGDFF